MAVEGGTNIDVVVVGSGSPVFALLLQRQRRRHGDRL